MNKKTSDVCCSFCGGSSKDLIQKEELTIYYSLTQVEAICSNCIDIFSIDLEIEEKEKSLTEFQFDLKPKDIVELLDVHIVGQSHAKRSLALAAYQHYKRIENEMNDDDTEDSVELDKSNILMVGPTGSGKTLLVKRLAKILNVPCYIARATSLTSAGYVGDDVESVIEGLLEAADMNVEMAERGIVFIDEVDKISKSKNSDHKDPSGLGAQNALLTLLEDDDVMAYKRSDFEKPIKVNTKNILFIASGAFSGISEIVNKRTNKALSKIGFYASAENAKTDQEFDVDQILSEDFVSFGLVPEFVGRFPIMTAIKGLTVDDVKNIITEPKNSIYKQYKKMFEKESTIFKIDDDAMIEIAKLVIKNKTGARGLRSVFNYFLESALFDASNIAGKKICVLSKDSVVNMKKVELRTIKKEKKSQA